MNCAEIQPLLHPYFDGELDLVRNLEVERHLKSCAPCAAKIESLRSLRTALRENDMAYRAPDALRETLRQMAAGRASAPAETKVPARRADPWLWKFLAFGATAFALLTILLRPAGISGRDPLLDEAVASHVRSLQANHLTDVASSDQHTVKPWFDGKIDFAPDVKDFAAQKFPLVGGRLDYLNGRAVAALVYRRDKHPINVFVWPEKNAGGEQVKAIRGYSIITRDADGMHYCLVSDLNSTELDALARLLAP